MPLPIFDELVERGVVAQTTDREKLSKLLEHGRATFYVGFDPTARSLHHGHLMQLVTARRLQREGHRAIVLVGGATGLIGDPRMTAERTLNDPTVVGDWADRLMEQVSRFVSFEGDNPASIVNNLEWTGPLSALDFLRNLGKHFRVSKMLSKEAVAARLESEAGISFTEFSYQILQANDYRELNARYGCDLQIGGSDQWGNITAGLDLIARTNPSAVHAMSTQLMVKSDGTKFGKTEGGAIWLDPELTSPYAFFQFWINLDDTDAARLALAFSAVPLAELKTIIEDHNLRPSARGLQRLLAAEMTTLVHGTAVAEEAERASSAIFGADDLESLSSETLQMVADSLPSVLVMGESVVLSEVLASSGLVRSVADARRQASQGAISINNEHVDDVDVLIARSDALKGKYFVLRRGRRNLAVVVFD